MRLAPQGQTYRATVARLRPTHAQWIALDAEERAARWVWNRSIALGRRLAGRGARLAFPAACQRVTRWRRRRPWLAAGSSVVQQQVCKSATDALAAWRLPEGHRGKRGRPRFKSARRGDAVPMRYTARGCSSVTDASITLAHLGPVRHGATRALAPVSSVDLTRDHQGWCISFRERVAAPPIVPVAIATQPDATLGLDFGIAQSWTGSDGTVVQVPTLSAAEARWLRAQQRTLQRRQRPKGQRPSRRYLRAKADSARVHRVLVNQRRDLLRHVAKALATRYALIAVEDLRLKQLSTRVRGRGRAAKAGLNRALLAQSRGLFLAALDSAARRTGTRVVRVPAAYTSQTCISCGHIAPENRESQAVFRCVSCGCQGHADVVAAENIRRRGVAALWERDRTTGDDTPDGEGTRAQATPMNRVPATHAARAA